MAENKTPGKRGRGGSGRAGRAARRLPVMLLMIAAAQGAGAAAYDLAVEDSMFRVRLDAAYRGWGCCEDGALAARPHPGSLPAPPFPMPAAKPGERLRQATPGEYVRQAELAAAGGEAEAFQVVIMARESDLNRVRVTATPLKADRGAGRIPPEQITFNQVGYVQTQRPGYEVERTGWFADPLLSPAQFDVKKGEVQPVWVTVRVPLGTPAGEYAGALTVRPENAGAQSVPVRLKVWGFEIPPRRAALRLAISWAEGGSEAIHGKQAWEALGLRRKYADLLLDHRIGPDDIYRSLPQSAADARYAVERGATAINLCLVGWPKSFTDQQIEEILKKIGGVWEQYRAAGIADKAYVFGFDENCHEPAVRQIYTAIGKRFPGLKRAVGVGWRGHEALTNCVDIWSMSTGVYWFNFYQQEPMREQLRAQGQEFWMYLSSSSAGARPNLWIENALIEARSLGWILYMHDADGLLYYFTNLAEQGTPAPIDEAAGPRTPWNPRTFGNFNGDGQLLYAGKSGPLASVRLANLRDAIEDHACLKTLERILLEKGKVRTPAEARKYVKENFVKYVTVNLWIHTHEPEVLRRMRARVAGAIVELSAP